MHAGDPLCPHLLCFYKLSAHCLDTKHTYTTDKLLKGLNNVHDAPLMSCLLYVCLGKRMILVFEDKGQPMDGLSDNRAIRCLTKIRLHHVEIIQNTEGLRLFSLGMQFYVANIFYCFKSLRAQLDPWT